MADKLPPSVLREEFLRLEKTDYNSEFDQRGLDMPDLLDLLQRKVSESNIKFDDLTKKFKPYHDNIDADHHLIGPVLLTEPRKFNIPHFQRDYSWGSNQHEQFWFELQDSLGEISSHTLPEMYMGSVYMDSSNMSKKDIIDGQQRLMTFLIMIRVINRYLDILNEDSPDESFWALSEFINGDKFMQKILYRANEKPVISAKEDDIQYFELLFQQSPVDIVNYAEEIEFEEEGSEIRLDTLLIDKLGISERKLDDYFNSSQRSDLRYWGTSHRLIIEAFNYYRTCFGKYTGVTLGIENNSLNLVPVETKNKEVTLRADTEGLTAAGVHVTLDVADNLIKTKTTDKSGKVTFDFENVDYDEATITAERFGKKDSITFSSISDIDTERLKIQDVDVDDGEFNIKVVNQDNKPVQGHTVSVDEYETVTNKKGVAEFVVSEIEEEIDSTLNNLSIKISNHKIFVDDVEELNRRFEISQHTDKDRAMILLNILQVLFHSMRVVHVNFGVDNPEYKIDVFQSLNDRGKSLDIADIIRARIIGSEANKPDIWEKIYRRHGKDSGNVEDFLEDYLIAEQGLNSPSSSDVKALFSTSRPKTDNVTSGLYEDPDTFLDELNTYSKRYFEISQHKLPEKLSEINGLHHNGKMEKNIRQQCNRSFARLDRGVEIWKPFILCVHKRFSENSNRGKDFLKILNTVERIVLRYSFYGTDISSTVTSSLFPKACRMYNSENHDPFDPAVVRDSILIPNVPPELSGRKVIKQLITKDNWQTPSATTVFLALAENNMSTKTTSGQMTNNHSHIDPDADLTIEHILPRKYILSDKSKNKKAWLDYFFKKAPSKCEVKNIVSNLNRSNPELSERDKTDIDEYFVNDIGNMMLLTRNVNSAVQNKLFSKKIVYYYLVCKIDMERTGESLLNLVSSEEDIIELIEELAKEADIDDEKICKLLGVFLKVTNTMSTKEIVDKTTINLNSTEINETDFEEATEYLSDIISLNGLDETDSSLIPSIVDDYNCAWNIKSWQDRKRKIAEEMKEYITFEGKNNEGEFKKVDISNILDEDFERRIQLRPAR